MGQVGVPEQWVGLWYGSLLSHAAHIIDQENYNRFLKSLHEVNYFKTSIVINVLFIILRKYHYVSAVNFLNEEGDCGTVRFY